MQLPVLNANYRIGVGTGSAHRSRAKGQIPAVVYDIDANKIIEVDKKDLESLLTIYGNNALINVQLGENRIKCLIREVQYHPIHRNIIHVDFKPVNEDTRIHTRVPIRFTGVKESARTGGILQKQRQNIEVECLASSVPKYISADIGRLAIGESFSVQDIEIAEELTLLTRPDEVLVTLIAPKDYAESEGRVAEDNIAAD